MVWQGKIQLLTKKEEEADGEAKRRGRHGVKTKEEEKEKEKGETEEEEEEEEEEVYFCVGLSDTLYFHFEVKASYMLSFWLLTQSLTCHNT